MREQIQAQRARQDTLARESQQNIDTITRMESQPDPEIEDSEEGTSMVNMKPSEPPNLEECANYYNFKKRLRLWEAAMVYLPAGKK